MALHFTVLLRDPEDLFAFRHDSCLSFSLTYILTSSSSAAPVDVDSVESPSDSTSAGTPSIPVSVAVVTSNRPDELISGESMSFPLGKSQPIDIA